MNRGSVTVSGGSVLSENVALTGGGAVAVDTARLTIKDASFAHNRAAQVPWLRRLVHRRSQLSLILIAGWRRLGLVCRCPWRDRLQQRV